MTVVSGVIEDWSSSWRGTIARRTRRRTSRTRSRARTTRARAPRGDDEVAVDLERAPRPGRADPDPADEQELAEPEQAEADDLAREQVGGPDRREHDLDDARGLLLDDARRDPEAEGQQLAVEQEHRGEREPAAASRSSSGPSASDPQRRRVERPRCCASPRPRRCERPLLGTRPAAPGGSRRARRRGRPPALIPAGDHRVESPSAAPAGGAGRATRRSTFTRASKVGAVRTAACAIRRRAGRRPRPCRWSVPSSPKRLGTTATSTTMTSVMAVETRNDFWRRRSMNSRRATRRDGRALLSARSSSSARRNSWVSVGRSLEKRVTCPAARATSSTASGSTPSARSRRARRRAALEQRRARPDVEPAAPVGARTATRTRRPRARSRSSSTRAFGHEAPVLDDGDRLAQPLDQLELVAGEDDGTPPRRASRSTPVRTSTPTGSRPENGSSSTSSSGSWTSATAELDALLVAERQLPRPGRRPGRRGRGARASRRPPAPAAAASRPCRRREVDELVADPHLRVQPALLGHVAEPAAQSRGRRAALPAHLPASAAQHPEHDPHRRRLAGAVGADEAEHLARGGRRR